MVTCPNCKNANAPELELCTGCGLRIEGIEAESAAGCITVGSGVSLSASSVTRRFKPTISEEGPETAAAMLSTPMPEPMVEPILTPTPHPPDSKPLPAIPALTLPLSLSPASKSPTMVAEEPIPALLPPASVHPAEPLAPQPRPKLVVLRGQRVSMEYPIYDGRNTVGRFVDKPVDIDLLTQESEMQTWCSRLHAAIVLNKGLLFIEDLNSLNGTWINGLRINPGQLKPLQANDVVQIGTVQMKVILG